VPPEVPEAMTAVLETGLMALQTLVMVELEVRAEALMQKVAQVDRVSFC
jgi:hypothetical protein